MSYKSKNKKYIKTRSTTERMVLLAPMIFILAVIPLIMRYHAFDPKLSSFDFFPDQVVQEDYFLYWKQWLFVTASAVMLCIITVRAISDKKTLKFTKLFIPLAVYALLALLSTIFSKYSSFGFTGIMEQFENLWALLGYALLPYYAYLMIESEEDVRVLLSALAIGASVLGLLGVSQAVGHNFWKTSLGSRLIFPYSMRDYNVNDLFGSKVAYLSLYNPNYVGVYVGLVTPVIMVLLFFSRKLTKSIHYALVLIALLVSLFSSRSDAGFIGIAFSIVVLLFFLRKFLLKKWYVVLPIILVIILSFVIMDKANNTKYFESVKNNIKNNLSLTKTEPPVLSNIETADDYVAVIYGGNTLYTSFSFDAEGISLIFNDEAGESVEHSMSENGTIVFSDSRFSSINVSLVAIEDIYGFDININGRDWYFTNQLGDNTYYYFNIYGKPVKIIPDIPVLFTGYERLFSNRGFIWSHTLPLLKDNIFLGSGADTFLLSYPQYDYVNLINNGYSNQFISKPHSFYLQMGVQTGVISLIAFLVFYFIYFIGSVRIYIKQTFKSFLPQAGLAVFVGTLTFMVVGLTNDSMIVTTPVYWALLGIGIAINKLVHNEEKVSEK